MDRSAQSELSLRFADYLMSGRAPRASAELAHTLARSGYQLEAAVLSGAGGRTVELPGSVWHGRRLWADVKLPASARAGDVWLDLCQLTPMVLVPRGADVYAWIDMRPMHRWQYATFLALAEFAPRAVQLDPPLTVLDRSRLLRGSTTRAITDLIPDEARLCANWFGKAVGGQFVWQMARAYLPDAAMAALWENAAREWSGVYAEGVMLAISAETIDRDPEDELEADVLPPAAERMIFGEWAHSRTITFRSCVYLQLGLLGEPGEDRAWYLPHRLISRAPR